MPTEPRPTSLFDVVKRAVEVADPDDRDGRPGELLLEFEDDDEPVASIGDLESRVGDALARIDPGIDEPPYRSPPRRSSTSPVAGTSCMPRRSGSSVSPRARSGKGIRRSG
jgi:hypothetical protein